MTYYILSHQRIPLNLLFKPSDILIFPSDRIAEIIRIQGLSADEVLYFRDEIVKEILDKNIHQIFMNVNNWQLSFAIAAYLIWNYNSTIWVPRIDWELTQQGKATIMNHKITGKERLIW